jgi:hypothetical protein
MMQVEAVLQMLQPGFSVAGIAAKRRNKSNPWFKRGTLLRRAGTNAPREIAMALIADKAAPATRKQFMDGGNPAALRKRDGVTVVGEGALARWRLADA